MLGSRSGIIAEVFLKPAPTLDSVAMAHQPVAVEMSLQKAKGMNRGPEPPSPAFFIPRAEILISWPGR